MADLTSEVGPLKQWSESLRLIAEALPASLTLRQALTFAMILESVSMGRDITMTDLKGLPGGNLIPESMGRSYQVFLPPTERDPKRMDWLYLETDAQDNRRKTLRLTKKGEAMARKISKALKT